MHHFSNSLPNLHKYKKFNLENIDTETYLSIIYELFNTPFSYLLKSKDL